MQHTLVAVFDNSTDAQKAMDDLLASGFNRSDVRLSNDTSRTGATTSATMADGDESFGDSIKNFFADLFGSDSSDRSSMYSDAVSRGNCVLTVTTRSEPEVERAADVVEAHGPIDIDEHHDMPMGGNAEMRSAAMARGAQQTSQQSMSMQSGSGASMGGGTMSSQGTSTGSSRQFAETDTQAIPVMREELKIGKREVQRGGVRIFSHVVEEPVSQDLSLREEHVSVQRRAVDQPIDPADVRAFKDTTIEMRESAEEAVVQKSARVVEEVTIGKEVTNREEHIRDTLRHTEVEVEKLAGSNDDDYYRSHWNSNFAGSGKSYDDIAPAYRYGSEMRRSELYRGRPWEDVETDLRSDWTQRNPGSTWESIKAAVRHGWNRLTD